MTQLHDPSRPHRIIDRMYSPSQPRPRMIPTSWTVDHRRRGDDNGAQNLLASEHSS